MKTYSDDNSDIDKILHDVISVPSEDSSILNAIPLALFRINSEKKITWWNDRFEKLTSMSSDILYNAVLDDIFVFNEENNFSFFIDKLNYEENITLNAFSPHESCKTKYQLQFSNLENENLSLKQILVTVTVIPENNFIDDKDNCEYLQMQNIVNTLPFLIYLVSVENKFLLVNNKFCDFVRLSSSEIIGYKCSEILTTELCDYLAKENKLLLSDKIPVEYKGTVSVADKKFNLSVKKSPLFNSDNSVAAICGVIEDITEQYQIQKQLQQTQKMEAVGQLTGGIAHDFNNILASILGYTGLINRKVESYNDQDITDYLRQIMRSGERARDLVQQLLAFSRGDVAELQVLEPENLAKEAIKMLTSVIPSSIKLNLRLKGSNVKNYIEADPIQFNQSLMNLVINAKDAIGDETGYINVSVECIPHTANICNSCHINFSGKYVKLSVSDSGAGIDSNILDRIFDPFFTTKEVGKGSGMGLSMLHGIVHASGGHIVVQSILKENNKTE
ncbi:MAG: ATP-binding protein, partial [Gammaproteobacteria bacterium]|nr:ATP-binding protein [Gammaproteobacteria bacterium]